MDFNQNSWTHQAHQHVYSSKPSKVEKALGGLDLHGITTEELDRQCQVLFEADEAPVHFESNPDNTIHQKLMDFIE